MTTRPSWDISKWDYQFSPVISCCVRQDTTCVHQLPFRIRFQNEILKKIAVPKSHLKNSKFPNRDTKSKIQNHVFKNTFYIIFTICKIQKFDSCMLGENRHGILYYPKNKPFQCTTPEATFMYRRFHASDAAGVWPWPWESFLDLWRSNCDLGKKLADVLSE